MRILIISITFGLLGSNLLGQGELYQNNCGFFEVEKTISNNSFKNKIFENWYENHINNTEVKSNQQRVILPLVFHIIHNSPIDDISYEDVLNSVSRINNAFGNLGEFDSETGIDTGISYCLANRDPSNLGSNGINRIISPLSEFDFESDRYSLPQTIIWNPKEYINIWVVDNLCFEGSCDELGFAYPPLNHGLLQDGIVIESKVLISSNNLAAVLVHEIGHYFGLLHTFHGGCGNDNCLENGDKVCDTPPKKVSGLFPCEASFNSCFSDTADNSIVNPFRDPSLGGIGDQIDLQDNFMDYGDVKCLINFTEGQKERILFFLDNVRFSLKESNGCLEPCTNLLDAVFSVSATQVFAGESIDISNFSSNSDEYYWYLNNELISTDFEPLIDFTSAGVFKLTLLTASNDDRCSRDSMSIIIYIECDTEAIFNSIIDDGILKLDNESNNYININWQIFNTSGEELLTSSSEQINFQLPSEGLYQICLTSSNKYCDDIECEFVQAIINASEICDNNIDDDGDGYIDYFDNDCQCNEDYYHSQCPAICEYVPASFPGIELSLKWESNVISNVNSFFPNVICGDIDNDDVSEIVSCTSFGGFFQAQNGIVVINGEDGQISEQFDYSPNAAFSDFSFIATARVENVINIILLDNINQTIKRFDIFGNLLAESPQIQNVTGTKINLADFNQDGTPEIYISNSIFNCINGELLVQGMEGAGCNMTSLSIIDACSFSNTVAADFLPTPGLELAAGNTVYSFDIVNTLNSVGNTYTATIANSNVRDGLTAVSDFDLDGNLDVIVVRNETYSDGGGIWVWDPRTTNIIAQTNAGPTGGVPFVGDLDNDCYPEIGVVFDNELRIYKNDFSGGLNILYSIPTSDNSGLTGMTAFDLNNDGIIEIIYRDQTSLYIIDGPTGDILTSYPINSGTGQEYPLVADVDNDGSAEIVVNGFDSNPLETKLYCFESSNTPWSPARNTWNQYNYYVTNINDDLSIPINVQNQSLEFATNCARTTCSKPYNYFLSQATFRDQEGCIIFPSADLSIDSLFYRCQEGAIIISIIVETYSDILAASDSVYISLYGSNPLDQFTLDLDKYFEQVILETGYRKDTFEYSVNINNDTIIYILLNDINENQTPIEFPISNFNECDYNNNFDSLFIALGPVELELGPDIIKCENEVVTVNAGNDFYSYLWSDGSTNSSLSTSNSGIFYLTVVDNCGNQLLDSITISNDTITTVQLIDEINVCQGEEYNLVLNENLDDISWFPADIVDCDSCNNINITVDSSMSLVLVASINDCIVSDTINIIHSIPPTIEIDSTICQGDSIRFFNSVLRTSGCYSEQIGDCDSIYILNLLVTDLDSSFFTSSICEGDSLLIGGNVFKNNGTFVVSISSDEDCDSIVILDLIVENQSFVYDTISLCHGDSVFIHDEWRYDEGIFESTESNIFGCDSTHSVLIELNNINREFIQYNLCESDSILISGEWIKDSGIYVDTIFENNCFRIVENTVIVNESTIDQYNYMLCQNDSVLIEDEWYGNEGLYQFDFINQFGCDSILIYIIEFHETLSEPKIDIDCDELEIIAEVEESDYWNLIWSNGDTLNQTTFDLNEEVSLYANTNDGLCSLEYYVSTSDYIDLENLPMINDIDIEPGILHNIELLINNDFWQITWSPSWIVDCDTCSNVFVEANSTTEIEVTLIHISGCQYKIDFVVNIIKEENSIFIPNIFSPNQDGNNDSWVVTNTNENSIISSAYIYDRWGNMIGAWNNTNEIKWNGYKNGELLEQGVYVFIISYTDKFGIQEVYSGNITLLR